MAMQRVTLSVEGFTASNVGDLESSSALNLSSTSFDASTKQLTTSILGELQPLLTAITTITTIEPTVRHRQQRITLSITGMTCMKCVNAATAAAEAHGGTDVLVILESGLAHMFFDGDIGKLVADIAEQTGKSVAHLPPTVLRVTGMTCQACVRLVTEAAEGQGSWDIHVSLKTGIARMGFQGSVQDLIHAIQQTSGKHTEMVKKVVLKVVGMSCGGCVGAVKRSAEGAGAVDVHVDLASGLATMFFAGDLGELIALVREGSGKESTVVEDVARSFDDAEKRVVTLRVQGMTCMRCVAAVTKALQAVDGTENVNVDLETDLATLSYNGDVSLLIKAIAEGPGKEATLVESGTDTRNETKISDVDTAEEHNGSKAVTLRVDGMTCMRCVEAVTKALQAVDGTENVEVNLTTGLATLSFPGDESVLIQAIAEGPGKEATIVNPAFQSLDEIPQMAGTNEPPLLDLSDETQTPEARAAVTLRVIGMTCMRCVNAVTKALQSVEGTERVAVDLATGLATLLYAGDLSILIQAIFEGAGKEALVCEPERESRGVTLRVEGMTNMKCVGKITKALSELDTAEEVHVSLDTGLATLSFAGEDDDLIEAVANAGKTATVVAADHGAMVELSLGSPTRPERDELIEFGTSTYASSLTTTQLRVEGMTCASCVGVVEGVLKKLPGVSSAKVNLLAGRATVIHDAIETTAESLSDAVSSSGYQSLVLDSTNPEDKTKSNGKNRTFRIDFQTDLQADSALKTLRYLEGVKSVTASYNIVTITLNPGVPKSVILRILEADGSFGKMFFRQSVQAEREQVQRGENEGPTDVIDKEARMWRRRFLFAAIFFVPIAITSLTGFFLGSPSMNMNAWIHFLLATPVQFICGAGFYRGSYYALKKRRATMDCLIALSTSIAYFSSVFVLFFGVGGADKMSLGHSAMFRTSAMILVMVLAGKWIEANSKKKAARGIAEMSQLTPDEAVLYDEKEQVSCFTVVPVKLVDVGDVVKVIAGDKIPVDGDVIDGVSAVDESMMTGESSAMPKSKGDHVIGGTVNGSGSMLVRATAVGSDAVLSQIVKLVNDAQTSRAPVEAYADAVSAVFVPVVIAISVLVFFVWFGLAKLEKIPADWYAEEGKFFFALLFALETMVIACPCALGLATPTAVMVASSVGSNIGVLFRGGGAAIEAANNVATVLFDKTGTLTRGKPTVAAMITGERGNSVTEQARVILSDIIYLVESESHHPLAAAITNHIETKVRKNLNDSGDRNLPAYKISSMEEVPGRGIIASINKGEYSLRVGSTPFVFSEVSREDVLTASEIRAMDRMEREDGLTLVSAVVNNELACFFGLEDTVREEAADVVECLHSMGVSTGLITGDSNESGRAVASKIGMPFHGVHAQALPWTKVSVVEDNQPACFVGDGINDAPALAAASLGIAIGAGAPVAAESAAVVLVGPRLEGVVNALDLARTTFRRVRLNFFWAIGYNVLGIPLAAGVLYPLFRIRVPPFIASGAMALSSTCVVLSSLGLYLYKPRMVKKEGEMDQRESEKSPTLSRFDREDVVGVPLLSAQV